MSPSQLETALCGTWRLSTWSVSTQKHSKADSPPPQFPFGPDPVGLLLYSPDGFMSATVCAKERSRFAEGVSPRQTAAEDLAAAFVSFFHYAGRWRVEGNQVFHDVSAALNPNMVGTTQARHAEISGTALVLTGVESLSDRERHHRLTWHRAETTQEGHDR